MRVKTSYILTHARSFRKAFNRITQRNMTTTASSNYLKINIDIVAVWEDILREFKMNRSARKHIKSIIKSEQK